MDLSGLTDADAVRQAIAEFDRTGREQFLNKYGFGVARAHFLRRSGKYYDSKAIAGAAYEGDRDSVIERHGNAFAVFQKLSTQTRPAA